jgi:hypothetical protein
MLHLRLLSAVNLLTRVSISKPTERQMSKTNICFETPNAFKIQTTYNSNLHASFPFLFIVNNILIDAFDSFSQKNKNLLGQYFQFNLITIITVVAVAATADTVVIIVIVIVITNIYEHTYNSTPVRALQIIRSYIKSLLIHSVIHNY